MSDLKAQFETAVATSKTLTRKPSNDMLLRLYAHYKQATEGDVSGQQPGMLDMVGGAKYDAWAKLKGTSRDDAMQAYVKLIERLKREER
jgi:acyl-CoA-binding protein